MTNDPQLEQAAEAVAISLGVDVAYFAPPEERHFDPISIGIAVGSLLLVRFLKGMEAQAGDDAEELGRRAASWLHDRLAGLFSGAGDGGAEAGASADLEEAAGRARAAVAQAGVEAVQAQADAARAQLEAELLDYGMPAARARRIAAGVAVEALGLARAGP